MSAAPAKITLAQWDRRYDELRRAGLREPFYGGPLSRHVSEAGDLRLPYLCFDNSPAALRLWNFLLTEEERLHQHRAHGRKIVGTMKDLGTVPVMAYAFPGSAMVAFYPDGAWWTPCVMQMSDGLLRVADSLGVGESFCPVRAVLGAFVTQNHFPLPDLITCSVGATCDDLSAIAQRLMGLGHPILWWEIPARRSPETGEEAVTLPGGFVAPVKLVAFVRGELERVKAALEALAGQRLDDAMLAEGLRQANRVRALLAELRRLAFTAPRCPMPALEMLIAEMLALHYCSDRDECLAVLGELLDEVRRRVAAGQGVLPGDVVRVYWVNPVADLRVMNLLEDCGGRVCGTEYLFCHALDPIPEDLPPLEALARMALADPMVGPAEDRARRIVREVQVLGAQAVVISRIPGASHCALEGAVIADMIRAPGTIGATGVPVLEIEVPPISDALAPALRNRIEALVETAKGRINHEATKGTKKAEER
jgi:hypothetical protein